MGYPVSANSPQVTIGSRTVCAAAFDWPNPVGTFFNIGVYEKTQNSEWLQIGIIAQYANDGDVLADIKAKGGFVKYMQWVVAKFNALFASLFSAGPTPPPTEPTTDAQARAFVAASLAGMKLVNVNGVPTLQ
jgi:hypothetical protein